MKALITIASILILSLYSNAQSLPRVIRSTTDKRGLTSVIFSLNGKVYALDYLTKKELKTFIKTGRY